MKRVAVCLSGQSRTWKYCVDSIKSFLKDDEYQIDYFIHTWDCNDYRPIETKDGNEKYYYKSESNINEYIEAYNPKLYKIQSYESFKKKFQKLNIPKLHFTENPNMDSQMYSFKQSIILKRLYERRNNFKYDFVLKIRPDLFFIYPSLRKNIELLYPMNQGKFFSFFSYEEKWRDRLENPYWPDLYWLFTSSEDADIFSTYFSKSIQYLKTGYKNGNLKEYNFYKFAIDINFEPYYDKRIERKELLFLYIIRPWNIPIQGEDMKDLILSKNSASFDTKLDKFIRTFYNLHSLMQPTGISDNPNFEKRKMLVDILKETNKLDDLKSFDIIDIMNEDSYIKETIVGEIQKIMYK